MRQGVPIHRPLNCFPKGLFRLMTSKSSKFRISEKILVTRKFPTQRDSNVENVSPSSHYHALYFFIQVVAGA